MTHIIVLGNEKGGSGKSTTAIHVIASLLDAGYKVASLDVDARQGTLTRYLANRTQYADSNPEANLLFPKHQALHRSTLENKTEAEAADAEAVRQAVEATSDADYLVIDTAGNDTFLSRHAHSYADTLITPLNDSFVDLDVLCHVNPESLDIQRFSTYADWVFEQKKTRAFRDKGTIDWIVVRNRMMNIHSHNKERMDKVLTQLSKRLSFKVAPGFTERVIFRELFNQGLTLLDLTKANQSLSLSHVAARQELRSLMQLLQLKKAA